MQSEDTFIGMDADMNIQYESKKIKITDLEDQRDSGTNTIIMNEQVKKTHLEISGDECQLITDSKKSTAFNTNAPTTNDVSLMDIEEENEDPDTDPMVPYADFNWRTTAYPE